MRLVTSSDQRPWGRVVSVDGDVDHLEGRRLFDELYHALTGPLIIDVTAMDFIDTAGLAAILEVLKYARPRGDPIILAGPKPHIRRAFHIAGLEDLAPWLLVTESVEEAKEMVVRGRRAVATRAGTRDGAPVSAPIRGVAAAHHVERFADHNLESGRHRDR